MTIIIFIIILGALVFVHELGHFLVAKKAGVKVEEFGFGYPPRALVLGKRWGTLFTLNWIPFGGFVRIFGENYEEAPEKSQQESVSRKVWPSEAKETRGLFEKHFPVGQSLKHFTEVSKKWQVAVLGAGVTFNILFAWLLFSLGFLIGLPAPIDNDFGADVKNLHLTVVGVLPESPADEAGLKTGDRIDSIENLSGGEKDLPNAEEVSKFINESSGELTINITRGDQELRLQVLPEAGIVEDKKAIGIEMDMVGTLSLPLHKAIYQGGKATVVMTYLTVDGLFNLAKDALFGRADVSQVTGPVGIVSLVGDASRLGISYLITFTSLISINLPIINLVPFPALDGGRILFVAIEALTHRPINPKFAQITNAVSFALLITLMIFVTYRDILNLF